MSKPIRLFPEYEAHPWEYTAPLTARAYMALLNASRWFLNKLIKPVDDFKTTLDFKSYALRDKWCLCMNCEERRTKRRQAPWGKNR